MRLDTVPGIVVGAGATPNRGPPIGLDREAADGQAEQSLAAAHITPSPTLIALDGGTRVFPSPGLASRAA